MSFTNPLAGVQQAFAPVTETMDSAGSLWDSFVNILKMALFAVPVLLGGGFLINYMRDQGMEMPDWLTGIVDTIFGGLGGLLGQIPGPVGEWLGGLFARNTNDAIAGATDEQVTGHLNGAPPALSAVLTPQAFRQSLRDVARTPEGEIPMTDLLTTKRGLTRMLTTDNGRTALRSIITALRTDFPNGLPTGAASESQTAAGGMFNIATLGPRVKTAIGEILADSAGFARIWENADSRALLIDGASLASGITFGENNAALATFLGTEPAAARTLMTSFMNNPETALTTLINDPNVTSESLYGLLSSANVSADSPFAASLQNFRDMAPNLETFSAMRTTIQEIGETRLNAFQENPVQALATYGAANAENRLTAENLQGLARAARLSGAEVPPLVLNLMENHGEKVLTLVGQLGTQDFQQLGTLLQNATAEIPADAEDAAARQTAKRAAMTQLVEFVFANDTRRGQVMGLLNEVSADLPEDVRTALQATEGLSSAAVVTTTRAINASNLTEAEQGQLSAAVAAARGGDYQALVGLMFKDDLRGRMNNAETQAAILILATEESATPLNPQQTYDRRTVGGLLTGDGNMTNGVAFNQALRTPDGRMAAGVGAHNIERLMHLADRLDRATGGGEREQEADDRNARIVNLLLRVSSGQEIDTSEAGLEQIYDDLQRRMQSTEVVAAIDEFFKTADFTNMSPRQQQMMTLIKNNWWIDRSPGAGGDERPNGVFESWVGTQGLFGSGFADKDSGLAAALSDAGFRRAIVNGMLGVDHTDLTLIMRSGAGYVEPITEEITALGNHIAYERDHYTPAPVVIARVDTSERGA